ncbi:maestro heat-like repeat family member 5 isoform X1 [Ochotona princeps]|uniref:maestro heat-like repeat family member 5 isoform X1 n=1 Tax=Ochotona princeps TaxID=9978 RepID=UPI0027144DA3|nr:maestro heat-like repeat family member 5 isoform X1 [Ochotona princeps]
MDRQRPGRPHSLTSSSRTSSAMSHNPRILPLISASERIPSPQELAHRDRPKHPDTILLHKSESSQAALVPQKHGMFMEEAYNAAICFKMLRDVNTSDSVHLNNVIKKLTTMAHMSPDLVVETIHSYFRDNPEISARHTFRLFQVLEAVIRASDSLEETWEKTFMQLALENMTKNTDLEDAYQDAASNVLVAICKHSWQAVVRLLETELLTGVFPHRSILYVMGMLSSAEGLFTQEDKACWEEKLTQMAVKSVSFLNSEAWCKELLWALTKPSWTQQEQSPEKAFLFTYYGLILQAEENSIKVRTHLQALLETSHQWPKQREGMALTVGLAAARHLDDVWAVLDQFGRSKRVRWCLHLFSVKGQTPGDLRWKWAGSTILLAYGQVAAKAKAHILPWVDNILSRMIFYFQHSSWDETLRQSFLTATLTLVGAISRTEGAHSYEFSQTSELVECLKVLMEKEPPDVLSMPSRWQTLHLLAGLCKLRPPMGLDKKSQLLTTCLHGVFALPPLDTLQKHSCLFLDPPDIQTLYSRTAEALDTMLQSFLLQSPSANELHFLLSHLYMWLVSEKAHERQRAVHSCVVLLQFLNHKLALDPKEDLKRVGQLVGMLGILCQDPDEVTRGCSLQGLGHLYQFLMRHKNAESTPALPWLPAGEALQVTAQTPKALSQRDVHGATLWSSGDQRTTTPVPPEFPKVIPQGIKPQDMMQHLTVVELTDLAWTAIDNLCVPRPAHVQAAAEILRTLMKEHGAKLKHVANMGRAIYLRLYSVHASRAKETALQAVTLLARSHTPDLVDAFLDFSRPLDSHAVRLWRALGAEQPVSRVVLEVLLAWLQKRPLPRGAGGPRRSKKTYLRSLAAMNTLHELQFAREFKQAVRDAYPKLFLALLTQMHYVLELNLPAEALPQQQAPEMAAPSPQNTSVEALKSLLSTTGHWNDFAHLQLQGAWENFTSMHTYPMGVGLLARAMVENQCQQLQAVLSQLLPSLQSQEERERKAAILILTEFLYSPLLSEVLPRQAALSVLARSLRDSSPDVRVSSLQGLGNVLFHPEKGALLRGQLPPFLNGFFQNSEPVVVRLMGTVSEVLHCLGQQGAGAQSLRVALKARSFFDDERDTVRAAAMALFGDLVAGITGRETSDLRNQVHQSMVPLLLHLKDQCPAVTKQAKFAFYRCAVLLHWRLQHTLFCTLAWERGLSARHFLWTCLMSGSQEEFGIHLTQALSYLHSSHRHIKTWAALFIGYTVCYHPQAVSHMVSQVDLNLLLHTFEDLKRDPEPGTREFASRQLSFLPKVWARTQP